MNPKPQDGFIRQVLDGETYCLRASTSLLAWSKAMMQGTMVVASSPLLVVHYMVTSVVWKLLPSWRSHLHTWGVPTVMKQVDEVFAAERRELLKGIAPGMRVLDVGTGGGAYLPYCSSADTVVAVEPAENLHETIQSTAQECFQESKTTLQLYTDLQQVVDQVTDHGDSTMDPFDYVILGNVLCEVPNVDQTLQQVHTVLKPGGKVYFCEHVARPRFSIFRFFQDIMNPLWHHVSMGCNCNRDSVLAIQNKDWQVISWTYYDIQVLFGPMVMGLAMKCRNESDHDIESQLVNKVSE